ncbi:MAG: type 4a pilus biogenesis protein PilO [Thermoanaerobaculia bacterium]
MASLGGVAGKFRYASAWAGLAVGALLFAFGYWTAIRDQKADIAAQRQRLAELEQDLERGQVAARDLPRFREELRRRELRLDRLLRVLPARRNTSELMRRIRQLTEQGNLDLVLFRPDEFVERGFYSEWPIAIQVDGTYHNLGTLFDRVSHLPRIVDVDDLQITALQDREAGGDRTIHASFTAKTFIYTEPAAGEPEEETP